MSDPMPGKPNDFVVRLDGLRLDEAAKNRIAGAIQSAVVAELGLIDHGGNKPFSALAYIPLKWRGYWLREIDRLPENIAQFNKQLNVEERG